MKNLKLSSDEIENMASEAANYLGRSFLKWRISVRQYKEKYGTVRVYLRLGWYCIQDVTHPGYAYNQLPKWLFHIDLFYMPQIFKCTGISYLSFKFHCFLYRYYYKKAIDFYPEIKNNILRSADYQELLKGL